MDKKKIQKGMQLILEGIGEDLTREGLTRTPERFAEMCAEIFGGKFTEDKIGSIFAESITDDIIQITEIPFYSMCEHHFLPFFGNVDIIYLPNNNRIAGFSSFSRIINKYSQRLQVQERLGQQIADEIMTQLEPIGAMVTIRATQLCASMRGDHKKNMTTVTQVLRGELPLERINRLLK